MIIEAKSIEDLRQRADIVSVIEHYVEVKKSGSAFVCVCPFHDDKNPSMSINAVKGFYHCFACKAGGDVFKFVQEFERVGFGEAVERVASYCNFTLNYTSTKNAASREIYEVLPLLNAFYKQNLAKHQNALKYLYDRALSDEDIRKFELGFAPSSNETLRLLHNEKISRQNALECGAVKFSAEQNERQGGFGEANSNANSSPNFTANSPTNSSVNSNANSLSNSPTSEFKGCYASFINRISFPIYDYKGLLIGFGGRTLDSENKAKYVNSPQCRIFDKSRVFYGIHLAKESIAKQREMIVCEGYMDAIAFHKAGLNNAVAVLGTALTEQHLPLIKRYEARVILCFDSDTAGFNAAMRSAFLLSTHKIDGKVIALQGGKDAAELVAAGLSKQLFEALERGTELAEFYIRGLLRDKALQTPLDKQKALEAVQKYTFALEPLVAQGYESLVAQLLGVDTSFVKLSRKAKPQQIQNEFAPSVKKAANSDLTELQALLFLCENPKFKPLFLELCDEICFKDKASLQAVLEGQGIENALVRELFAHSNRLKRLTNESEFLLCLCKINLGFLNRAKSPNLVLSLKKQLFSLLDKNLQKLQKTLPEPEFNSLLREILKNLKQNDDENSLMGTLKNFQKNRFELETQNAF